MRALTCYFIVATLILLNFSRVALALWQWPRARDAGGLWPILRGGLRIDAHEIAVLAVVPAVLGPWMGHWPRATEITAVWFQIVWVLLAFMEIATPEFIMEYDTRPNRLFIEYLKHPREVFGMLWRGYKLILMACAVLIAVVVAIAHAVFSGVAPDQPLPWWLALILSVVFLAIGFLAIRGTLSHRPLNPSNVAYCGDGLMNALPLNSLYSVLYAIYSMRYEKSASAVYGKMDSATMQHTVLASAGLDTNPPEPAYPSVHTPRATHQGKPRNLVIILQESLGAQFSAALGGSNLTPCLDALMSQGWNFTRTYATGTRSVRGLEAVVCGFLPTPAQAVLKLPASQRGFYSLADGLGREGYHSRFIYGGEAHFDNMKGFFLGNGFNEIIDRPQFQHPKFVGTWGVSDEDMYDKLHALMMQPGDKPTFTLAFTVSNHSPWEYPANRIVPDGNPATVENTVRYADWALGQYMEQARQSPYWEDTVFLIVADHDARVFGANLVPVRHFHIPALVLGGGIAARQDDRLISQIDLPPTLLSLIGAKGENPMLGHDLTQSSPDRAIMQYADNYGYLRGDQLVVLEPHRGAVQYRYTAPATYEEHQADPVLTKEALAHALWPSWAYREGRYSLDRRQAAPGASS